MYYFTQQKGIGSGSWCHVFDIGHGICLKLYHKKHIADAAYFNACVAEEHGIGPKVYGQTNYGYYTEIVRVVPRRDVNLMRLQRTHPFVVKVIAVFGDAPLRELGGHNIGINDAGNFVMIDFETEYWNF